MPSISACIIALLVIAAASGLAYEQTQIVASWWRNRK